MISTSTRARRRFLRLIGWSFSMLVLASPVIAQNQPVVFNSGFNSQGSAWVPTASWLQQRLLIDILTPNTGWNQGFAAQGFNYGSALNAWGRTNVIGLSHSNGGIVTRTYAGANGAASRLDRLATVGTPHRGAPIAANVLNGNVINYFSNWSGSIAAALYFYSQYDPDWWFGNGITEIALGWLYQASTWIATNAAFTGLGIGVASPVTGDVLPGSPFISQLNSASNLAIEASALDQRVGISTQVHPDGAFFALISSDPGEWRRVQAFGAYGALALYLYYDNHPDFWLAAHADYWLQVFWYTYLLDIAWQDFIGALVEWNGAYAVVLPSDGFIPEWSSQYPGATLQRNLSLPAFNISHTSQMNDPAARLEYLFVLRDVFGVLPSPGAPPSPPSGPECGTPGGGPMLECPI